jgi:molybdopterin-binding protein
VLVDHILVKSLRGEKAEQDQVRLNFIGGSMTLSARNHLKGKIEEIQKGDVLVHVTIRVGDHQIESVITKRSADEMALKEGDSVTAVVKATEVMLSKP